MPEIRPFAGIHYDPARVGDLTRVMTQPYDRIDDALQAKYYRRHPYSFVRVDKRREEAGDRTGEKKYAAAATEFESWLAEGVLVQDPKPALYVYHQVYRTPSGVWKRRKGVTAMVKLEEPGKGKILPHEETHSGPKVDRRRLLEATRTHLSHVFLLYSDPSNAINRRLGSFTRGRPMLEARDDYGEKHVVWRVDDEAAVSAVVRAMKGREAIIADGHHRYETAWGYRQDHPEATHVLATLVNMDDAGLTIFGTHRVIAGYPSWDPEAVGAWAQERGWATGSASADRVAGRVASRGDDGVVMGFVSGRKGQVWRIARPRAEAAKIRAARSLDWRSLDVNILHHVVLDGLIGITPEDTKHERYVTYHRSAAEAVRMVRSGRAQGAFLLRPVRIPQIRAIVNRGERFPQKTTDFYPKLLSGLVMARV